MVFGLKSILSDLSIIIPILLEFEFTGDHYGAVVNLCPESEIPSLNPEAMGTSLILG
jgi:hypothetical protein